MKDSSLTIKICDAVARWAIYVLVFLLPVLFLPWTSEALDFNKQTVLLFLVCVSLFAWMLKALVLGKFQLNLNKIHIFAGIFLIAYLLSTIFSVDKYGSFWGWPSVTSEALLSMIGLILFYFIVSNVFSKEEIIKSIYIFSVSALIVQIYGVFQLFGKNPTFNTIGGTGGLGMFAAVLLPLMIILLIIAKKWFKILFILEILFSALILALINYPIIWWTVVLGSALLIILGVFKRNLFDGRWMALPMFFLAVSLFFVILNPQINFPAQKINEISLSQQANFQIDLQAIKEKPVFGSGPGTFAYNFLKFKNTDLNKTVLWNVIFNNGNSKILTSLSTTGILGFLAFLAFIISVIFYGAKSFFREKSEADAESFSPIFKLGLFASLSALILSFFLHNSNFSLDFIFFFMAAILAALIFEPRKEYELKPSSVITLVVTFVFTLVFIFGLGLLILDGQRYFAEVNYFNGLKALADNKLDDGIKDLETAVVLNSGSDLYFRQLAQIYLLKIQEVAQDENKSQDDKTKEIQILVANSVNFAKTTTDINPQNASNWLVRGYVYQSLAGIITDGNTWAINSYNEALKLDPNNPYLLTQRGIAYYQGKDYQNAKADFQKALELKPDYQNAQDGIKAIEGASEPPKPEAPETSSDETGNNK